jgi:hypothetical protein
MQGFLNNGWGQVIVILIGIGFGVMFNNARITDLRNHVDKRIDDLDRSLRDLIKSEVKRLEDRLDRLERPILRP